MPDLSRAARTQRWADVVFVPLTGAGFQYARDYYLDYPLLFLNVLEGSGITKDPASVLPYLRPVTAPIPPQPALYLVKSTGTSATVLVDGASLLGERACGCLPVQRSRADVHAPAIRVLTRSFGVRRSALLARHSSFVVRR